MRRAVRAGLLRTLWGALDRTGLSGVMWRIRCEGNEGVWTWIPEGIVDGVSSGGYHRIGVQRRICIRLRRHTGNCLGLLTFHGAHVPLGTWFTPTHIGRVEIFDTPQHTHTYTHG